MVEVDEAAVIVVGVVAAAALWSVTIDEAWYVGWGNGAWWRPLLVLNHGPNSDTHPYKWSRFLKCSSGFS